MKYLLDTDHLSILQRKAGQEYLRLSTWMAQFNPLDTDSRTSDSRPGLPPVAASGRMLYPAGLAGRGPGKKDPAPLSGPVFCLTGMGWGELTLLNTQQGEIPEKARAYVQRLLESWRSCKQTTLSVWPEVAPAARDAVY